MSHSEIVTKESPHNEPIENHQVQLAGDIRSLEERLIEAGMIYSPIYSIQSDREIPKLEAAQGCNSRTDCFPYLRGGLQIEYPPFKSNYCTAAFNARSVTGQHYLITAGHCVQKNDHVYQRGGNRFTGVVDLRYYDGMDAARIKVLGPWKATRWIWADSVRQAVQIRGTSDQDISKGALVCYSGARTGYHCGKILRTHVNHGTWKNVWEANFYAQRGDSGGPAFLPGNKFSPTNVKAYGILGAITGSTTIGNGIREVERSLGVRVITD